MRILIKLPSRSRPDKLVEVVTKYIEFAEDLDNIKLLINMDDDDPTFTGSLKLTLTSIHSNITVIGGTSKSKIDAINRDMPDPSTFDIVLLASDDMIPQVKGYDQIIRNKMREFYPDTDGVLFFNDGHNRDSLNTILLCGSKYYKRFNYLYFPEYKSFFCDNEFMHVANRLGKQKYFDDVIIKHQHPVTNKEVEMDELYLRNGIYIDEDALLFGKRLKTNFGTPMKIGKIQINRNIPQGLKRLIST